MSSIVINDTKGLATHDNDLSTDVGSTSLADNVVFDRDGRPGRRRGFKDYSSNLPDFAPTQLIASASQDQAYLHLDNGIWYNSGGTWYRKRGSFGAKFAQPSAMWVDTSANVVYVCDISKRVIYSVNLTTGARAILAGGYGYAAGTTDGVGFAARFSSPKGICGDGAGNLYVSDNGNYTIRKIVISTATVSTFAGTAGAPGTADGTGAAAAFTSPEGMWCDGAGAIYVCDQHAIRKITYPGAIVTTFAGSVLTSGTTDATGTAARFNVPVSLWGDGAGVLYVADGDNSSVRKVTYPGAVVTTFAGLTGTGGNADGIGTAARLSSPTGIVGGSGVLWVTDNFSAIRKITYPGAVVTSPLGLYNAQGSTDAIGTAARFNAPKHVALVDSGAAMLVGDYSNAMLRKVYLSTLYVSTLAGIVGVGSASAQGLFADGIVLGPSE